MSTYRQHAYLRKFTYLWNLPKKLLRLMSEFRRDAKYKINVQKLVSPLYTSANNHKLKWAIPHTISVIYMKHL